MDGSFYLQIKGLDAGFGAARRVGAALVPERIEACRHDERRGKVVGAGEQGAVTPVVPRSRIAVLEPIHACLREKETFAELVVARVSNRWVGCGIDQPLSGNRNRRWFVAKRCGDHGRDVSSGAVA